jgi:four helix bundle protein
MGDFKKLRVWHESKDLTKDVFRAADKIEGTSARILRDQACRAVLSVPANIAEGSGKSSDREFARFVKIAIGSLTELESHLIIGQELGIISQDDYVPIIDRLIAVARKLTGLLTALIASAEEAQRQRPPRRKRTK